MTRRYAQRYGFLAEWAALIFLTVKGYRLIARNFRSRRGEIDLIMIRRGVLIFVEVKFRRRQDHLPYAISNKQWMRIYNAASDFVRHAPRLRDCVWRFDSILFSPWPQHQKDVWRIYNEMS